MSAAAGTGTLDGPRVPPASGRPPRRLVVLLHGYGADGNDLAALAEPLSRALPDAAFLAPHAPERCPEAPAGRQWFPLTFRDPGEYERGADAARPLLARFLSAECDRHGLSPDELALVGFSQGAMMALSTGLLGGVRPRGVVGFSGLLPLGEGVGPDDVEPLPVLLVHGTEDELLPAGLTIAAATRLSALGCAVEWHLRPGLGHGIDPEGLHMCASWLAKIFPP